MKKKYLIRVVTITILLFSVTGGFSQDTSKLSAEKHLRNNSDTSRIIDPNAGASNSNQSPDKAHAAVETNRGTMIPSTTSGTLSSSVNPNTQFVIPLHKRKRKSNLNATPDSGIIVPQK